MFVAIVNVTVKEPMNNDSTRKLQELKCTLEPLIQDVLCNPSLQKIDVSEELEVFLLLTRFIYDHIDDSA